jgi:heme-degrading monooxygenase HmoA
MHARLSTYEGPAEGLDGLVDGFDKLTDQLRQVAGFEGGYVLVDRASGNAATLTLWTDEQAAQESARQADEWRRQVAESGRHTITSVQTYDVALKV